MFRSKALVALSLVLVVLFSMVSCALADKSSDVLKLVNKERKTAGLKSLTLSEDLNRVAEARAAEIVENWSHTRPNGKAWNTAFAEEGVSASYRGENLGKGQYSANLVVKAWMKSEGHKDNILNKKFTKMGVASVVVDGVTYWVQVFANEVKTTKKTPAKSTANSKPNNQSGSKPSNSTGALNGLSNTALQAALSAPAAAPVLGKNPGL
jgi:hypothetical protein